MLEITFLGLSSEALPPIGSTASGSASIDAASTSNVSVIGVGIVDCNKDDVVAASFRNNELVSHVYGVPGIFRDPC